ncbi:hypothetical protein A3Q56_01928 [Intoshia linei]|uniref:EF-hand domain-containing protein n=1 Tax=Intoshia linei TaxID=1819745 RepID=A0A177B9F9_9BILA|nr:hypothetical protein A3Q56_01928 [Intoshia linei]
MSANSYYSNCAEKPRCGFAEKDKEINFPEDNTEILESMLRQDLQTNIKEILKDLHRLDYNCDGKINRNDLKQIIDTYHQKLTEDQFNKIYVRHDFHHRGIVDYSEFLQRLGVKFDGKNNFVNPKKLKIKVIGTKNTSVMTSRELDIYFRKKVCSNLNDLIKAFTAGQISDSSLLPIELVYSIFNEFTFKMTLQQFNQIMIKPNPQRNTNKNTSSFDVLFALKNHINQSFTSLKNAFIHLDENRIGKISRSIIKTFITKKLKIQVPINVMKEIMTALDPQHTNFINYHQFVKFFEQSNKIPEKWLESCHKYNKIISKPLPYDSTLKNLSDVINRKLPNLKKYLKIFNRTIDDYINREIIYRWICQNCFDIERKTFDNLSQQGLEPNGSIKDLL